MTLCDVCERFAKAISQGEHQGLHCQPIDLLCSKETCCFCSFLCSCEACSSQSPRAQSVLCMIIKAREEQLDDQTCIRWARRNECIFEFIFNLEGEVWWNILIGAEPGTPAAANGWRLVPTPKANHIEFIRSPLDACLKHHKCNKTISHGSIDEDPGPELPNRIIEILSCSSVPMLRLLETRGLHARYVTLSHCWGAPDKRPLRTMKSNIESHLQGISYQSLPRTFRAAIDVTWGIGLKYLWVDSLCIVQDDEEDWRRESAIMGVIYENATMMIGASSAKDSTEGLFKPMRRRPLPIKIPYYDEPPSKLPQGDLIVEEHLPRFPQDGPLWSRGWVFQERYLSRRKIYFTRGGLLWVCQKGSIDDFYHTYELPEHQLLWHRILHNYSNHRFTHASDRLIAIDGLANRIKGRGYKGYHFGVFHTDIVLFLLWWKLNNGVPNEDLPQIPSWSWASKSGAKLFWAYLHLDGKKPVRKTTWLADENIEIQDSGRMSINQAPILFCRTSDYQTSESTRYDLTRAAYLLWSKRPVPVSYIQVAHRDVQNLVGVAALDNESCNPSCCISLMRWERLEYVRPSCGSSFKPGENYWHIVLMLEPAIEGDNALKRVGMGIIPGDLWGEENVRYSHVQLL